LRGGILRALVFDPFAGISGDMTLGALLDLGLPEAWLRALVTDLGLGNIAVDITKVQRCGIACTKVDFELPHEHTHRHLQHVLDIVNRANVSPLTRTRAADAFQRIATAEAEVHGTTIEKVHFHEVGALDSILDVVCVMAGVEQLGLETFFTRPVAMGSGWIEIEHGKYPVPAPATLKILEGIPVTGLDLAGECTTPTGAALLAALTNGNTAPAAIMPIRTGFGAGTRDPKDRPNCLRAVACEVQDGEAGLFLMQTDIDDMSPEFGPPALDALLGAGALDAVVTPVTMKKGRAGIRLEALVPQHALDAVLTTLFRTTSTLGARYWPVTRPALPRLESVLNWRGQVIRRKTVRLPDGTERSKPEYEDIVRAAEALGLTPYEVRIALEKEQP
jgi:uncharacterized protein (TIGR00299 family) protein